MSYAAGTLGMSGLGTSAATSTSTDSSNTQATATPTTVVPSVSPLVRYAQKLRAFLLKNIWLVVFVLAGAVLFYTRQGRTALCSNLGVACDTRPLPGGVRALD